MSPPPLSRQEVNAAFVSNNRVDASFVRALEGDYVGQLIPPAGSALGGPMRFIGSVSTRSLNAAAKHKRRRGRGHEKHIKAYMEERVPRSESHLID